MKQYDCHEPCPKCGLDETDLPLPPVGAGCVWATRWIPAAPTTSVHQGHDEHLVIICTRCAYEDKRAPLDQGQ